VGPPDLGPPRKQGAENSGEIRDAVLSGDYSTCSEVACAQEAVNVRITATLFGRDRGLLEELSESRP
jgi:hypothetical protein